MTAELAEVQAAQQRWAKENRLRAILYENPWHDQLRQARERVNGHADKMTKTEERLRGLAGQKQAAWPKLEEQARRDLQPIAIKLAPEDFSLLLRKAYAGNAELAQRAMGQVEQHGYSVAILDDSVRLQRFTERRARGYPAPAWTSPGSTGTSAISRLYREQRSAASSVSSTGRKTGARVAWNGEIAN